MGENERTSNAFDDESFAVDFLLQPQCLEPTIRKQDKFWFFQQSVSGFLLIDYTGGMAKNAENFSFSSDGGCFVKNLPCIIPKLLQRSPPD